MDALLYPGPCCIRTPCRVRSNILYYTAPPEGPGHWPGQAPGFHDAGATALPTRALHSDGRGDAVGQQYLQSTYDNMILVGASARWQGSVVYLLGKALFTWLGYATGYQIKGFGPGQGRLPALWQQNTLGGDLPISDDTKLARATTKSA